jgi:putative membrane protein
MGGDFMRWLLGIIINAVLFMALAGFFKNSIYIEDIFAALAASFILSILNIFVKPFLVILTLPVTVLSLGLFLFVINAVTLMITDEVMGSSFEISSFGMALLISVIMSLVNVMFQQQLIKEKNK